MSAVAASLSGSTIPLQCPHLPHARPHLSVLGECAAAAAAVCSAAAAAAPRSVECH